MTRSPVSVYWLTVSLLITLFHTSVSCSAFTLLPDIPHRPQRTTSTWMTTTSSVDAACVSLMESEGDADAIADAAIHMVDCFWLNSPQQLLIDNNNNNSNNNDNSNDVSSSARAKLIQHQTIDLSDKFGERLGKRILDAVLIKALDDKTDETLGMVGIEVRLYDQTRQIVVGPDESEDCLKNTVASLGPKQRRQYKDASVQELATELLPPDMIPIVLLSNLSVSPKARRLGLAQRLCEDAERVAVSLGYNELYLKVEADNEAARTLYEKKLGFVQKSVQEGADAMRVDLEAGEFVQVQADTLVLTKGLSKPATMKRAAL